MRQLDGVLVFLDGVGRVCVERHGVFVADDRECVWTPNDGYIPLAYVLGAYSTIDKARQDLERCYREADRINDAQGALHPIPLEPLVFEVVMHTSSMQSYEQRTSVSVHPASPYTREFVAQRPVFFGRLAKKIGLRGSLITPKLVGELAYRFAEEIMKKWDPGLGHTRVVARTRAA